MDIIAVVAFISTAASVAVKVVGTPDQIRNNHRRKSTAGLSAWFMVSSLISYALWVVHGVQVHDMALIIGQGLGVIVTGIIVFQIFLYRKKSATAPKVAPTSFWGLFARSRSDDD
jgi:uncharacterized protein with PQ loop repeat